MLELEFGLEFCFMIFQEMEHVLRELEHVFFMIWSSVFYELEFLFHDISGDGACFSGAGVWFGVFHDISGDGACSSGAGARELLHAFFLSWCMLFNEHRACCSMAQCMHAFRQWTHLHINYD